MCGSQGTDVPHSLVRHFPLGVKDLAGVPSVPPIACFEQHGGVSASLSTTGHLTNVVPRAKLPTAAARKATPWEAEQVTKRLSVVLFLAALLLLITGCSSKAFLRDVTVSPAVISPNADGTDDVTVISYDMTSSGTVSIYLVDDAGVKHYFRQDQRRSPGVRTAYFSGIIDGSMLLDGNYRVVVEATDEMSRTQSAEAPLTIENSDQEHIEILNLSVYPKTFTPNRDGITDRVYIGYSLNKEASNVDVYLLGPDGTKYPVEEDQIHEMGAVGAHEHDYDAGVDAGASPPDDGDYTLVVEAEDLVGTKAVATDTITIEGGGVPMAEIVNGAAEFSSTVVPLGGTLTFTCTVKNTGEVPIRTTGPESGYTYTTEENYNSLKNYEDPGVFRIGLDYQGNSAGRSYPYRWQLGTDDELTTVQTDIGEEKYLMPGQTVTVVGHLVINEAPSTEQPYFWIGLIHEQVENVQDRIEATQITIGY